MQQIKSTQAVTHAGSPSDRGNQASRQIVDPAALAEHHPKAAPQRSLPDSVDRTGLPDNLKSGVEQRAGVSLDDVKVHRNSLEPAQLKAEEFAQGPNNHLSPGQGRHLPHEAWHVAQQIQGHVKPQSALPGAGPIKDGQILETEADQLGVAAERLALETAHKITRTQQGVCQVKAVNGASVLQMAGHAGVIIYGNNGRLLKRIEQNEHYEFYRIKLAQEGDQRRDATRRALGAFPKIYKVFDASDLEGAEVKRGYGDTGKVRKWLKAARNKDYYVEMESVGGDNIDVLDFKIGTATADKDELKENYCRSEDSANSKVSKMARVDRKTETQDFGLRDSDVAKDSKIGNLKRIMFRKFVPTLHHISAQVDLDKSKYLGPYGEEDQAIRDLDSIHAHIKNSDTVYIASSLVMKLNQDRKKLREDRVVLIDLAHPMRPTMDGFEEAKQDMLLGIENLKRFLMNRMRGIDDEPEHRQVGQDQSVSEDEVSSK